MRLRSVLYVNLVLLMVPTNGVLLRMLVCSPFFDANGPKTRGGFDQYTVAEVSRSAFWQDGDLVSALSPPSPHAHMQASGVAALFGGSENCYSGYHLLHAIVAIALFAVNVAILSLFSIAKRRQPLGTELHLAVQELRKQFPGCHVYALADVVYECWTPLASIVTFSVVADFLPRSILGLYAFLASTTIILFFILGGTSRELLYETAVLSCLISLSSVFFCAWYVSLGSLQAVDLGSTVSVMLFAGLFAGTAVSLSRNGRIHLSTLESQRWSAHVLQWVNLKTRAAASTYMAHARLRQAMAHSGQDARHSEAWLRTWDSTYDTQHLATVAACRVAIRPVTLACRGALHQLLVRYPQSSTAHLMAAEYLSSPVVSDDRHEQLQHVAAALRYSGGMPWHRIQCMQHLAAARQMHVGCVLQCLQSRQSQYESELTTLQLCAERVHSVRANVVQLAAASTGAGLGSSRSASDLALLGAVRSSMETVHTACLEVMQGLEQHRSTKAVHERLVRRFVEMVTVGDRHSGDYASASVEDGAGGAVLSPQWAGSGLSDTPALLSPARGLSTPMDKPRGGAWRFSSSGLLDAPSRRGFIPIFGSTVIREHDDPLPVQSGAHRSGSHHRHGQLRGQGLADPRQVSGGPITNVHSAAHTPIRGRSLSVVSASGLLSAPKYWLTCTPREITLHTPGVWSGVSQLPRVLLQVQAVLSAQYSHEAYFLASQDGYSGSGGKQASVSAHVSQAAKHHCVLHYLHGERTWAMAHASDDLLWLLGANHHSVEGLKLQDMFDGFGGASAGSILRDLQRGCTVRVQCAGGQYSSGSSSGGGGSSVLANTVALQCWSGGEESAYDMTAPQTSYDARTVACSVLLLLEPMHVQRLRRRVSAGESTSSVVSSARNVSTAWMPALLSPRNLTPELLPAGVSQHALVKQVSTGGAPSLLCRYSTVVSPGGTRRTAGMQQEVLRLQQLRDMKHEQTLVRHQLQRRVKHDKYSFQYLLGVMGCIVAISLYSIYSAYIVLGAGNNPLVTLRFRHPAAAAQMLPAGERLHVWSRALEALGVGQDSTSSSGGAGAAWQAASAAVSGHVRDLSEGLSQRLQLALSDAALLDASVGGSAVALSWRGVGSGAPGVNGTAAGHGSDHSRVVQAEMLLAQSFLQESNLSSGNGTAGTASLLGLPQPTLSVAAAVNSTAHVGVTLLNDAFDGILRTRTVLAIFLTTSFTISVMTYTYFVEAKLLQRATGALRIGKAKTHAGATGSGGSGGQGRQLGTVVEADLSPQAAQQRLRRQQDGSLGSCVTALMLRHLLFLQLAVAMALGIGLIALGFVRRYEPEDAQATSVNVVYSVHQMQHAAWQATAGLEAMLSTGAAGGSMAAGILALQAAVASYGVWQRVVFAGDDTGFMVSAAPGHTEVAQYPVSSAGEQLLYQDACSTSVGLVPTAVEQKYLSGVNGTSTAAAAHRAECTSVLDEVLLDGWQVASRVFGSGMVDASDSLQRLAGSTGASPSNVSACLGAMRSAMWLRVGLHLSGQRGNATVSVGVDSAMAWVSSECAGLGAVGSTAAAAWVVRAGDLVQLQAVHFDELAQASAVHGIRGFLASLAQFAVESMLPVGCVPVWLILFLWLVGGPAALSKRRTVQSAELMSALLRAHQVAQRA